MTVTYTAEVATCRGFGCFLKLLARWRGSIYKLVWMDLLAFLFLYYTLSCVYRYALSQDQKQVFESVVLYCNSYGALIPLSFVLGFYVSLVMQRWWDEYMTIPWPDPVAVYVSAHVHGQDERGRVMRRTVMRYVCLCLTMVLINMSARVKKRFPTMDHLVEAGLLVESEKLVIQSFDQKFPKHPKNWMPIVWASSIITRARKEGRVRDDFSLKTIIDELNKFRGMCTVLMHYDTISIPLVYTQVVTLAVYSYFLCNVMGKQWMEGPSDSGYYNMVDKYFPVFTTLEFFFYMGWLKVAESLINPFGEDDDDFEVNWLIDRNLQVSYLIVDEMHHEHPELIKDQYWDEVFPNELPYTKEAEGTREEPPEPSTARVDVTKSTVRPILSAIKIDKVESTTQLNGKSRPQESVQNLQEIKSDMSQVIRNGRTDQRNLDGVSEGGSSLSQSTRKPSSVSVRPFRTYDTEHLTNEELSADENQRALSRRPTAPNEAVARPALSELFNQTSDLSFKSALAGTSSEDVDGQSSNDDFERLRQERERQRHERQKQKLARIGLLTEEAHAVPPTRTPQPPGERPGLALESSYYSAQTDLENHETNAKKREEEKKK